MRGGRRRAVMAHAAPIGGADNLVLHGRLAGTALSPRNAERARRAGVGDSAGGMKFCERLQDDVDKLEIDHLIVRDRSRRLRSDERARREDEAHHVAHAVVEGELRSQTPDQTIKYAGLYHGWAQVHRPAGLRSAGREIESHTAVFDRDCYRELDW